MNLSIPIMVWGDSSLIVVFFCQVVLIGGESFGRSSRPSWFQPKIQLRVLDNLQQVKTLLEAPKAVP